MLADPHASAFIAGAAFHCYNGDPKIQSEVKQRFPDKDVWETECSPGLWSRGGNQLQRQATLLIDATRNWARSVVLWNLVLDPHNGPRTGGCKTCTPLVTIADDLSPVTVKMNAEYYALGHASKFVVPGAYRVDSETGGAGAVQHVAFRNPDGSMVLLAANMGTSAASFAVTWSWQSFGYTLPGGSLATFLWTPAIRPAVALSAVPGGLALHMGDSGTLELQMEPQNDTNPHLSLTCSGTAPGMTCDVTPSSLTVSTVTTATVAVRTSASSARSLPVRATVLGFALVGLVLVSRRRRILLGLILLILATIVGCGIGPATGGQMYRLAIAATPSVGARTVITVPVTVK